MKTSHRLRAALFLSVGAVGVWLWTAAAVNGQQAAGERQPLSARDVLDRVRQTIAAISSIEYEFEMKSVGPRPGATSNTSKYGQSGRFACAEGKFSSEYI